MYVVLAGAVAVLCALMTRATLQKRRSKASLRRLDLPKLPRPAGLPIVGNIELLSPNFHRVLSGWADQFGSVYRIQVFGMDGVVVSDPVAVGKILGHDHSTPDLPKHTVIYQVLDQVGQVSTWLMGKLLKYDTSAERRWLCSFGVLARRTLSSQT